ncbi:hypothetical protein HORM4_510025 [Vibrio harveyi]|nr:hypothetical protein HORM4_510025 [Vibrio harveyi]
MADRFQKSDFETLSLILSIFIVLLKIMAMKSNISEGYQDF